MMNSASFTICTSREADITNSPDLSNLTADVDTLLAHLDALAEREAKLRELLLDDHRHYQQRDQEIHAALDQLRSLVGQMQQSSVAQVRPVNASSHSPITSSRNGVYQQLIGRVREVVHNSLAPGDTVIVVSKGDDELLKFDGRIGWHFPQNEKGIYAGHYPPDSAAALEHLRALRAKGGNYLLIPSTAFWWLDHYAEFGKYLKRHCREVVRREDACVIYSLREPSKKSNPSRQHKGGQAKKKLIDRAARV